MNVEVIRPAEQREQVVRMLCGDRHLLIRLRELTGENRGHRGLGVGATDVVAIPRRSVGQGRGWGRAARRSHRGRRAATSVELVQHDHDDAMRGAHGDRCGGGLGVEHDRRRGRSKSSSGEPERRDRQVPQPRLEHRQPRQQRECDDCRDHAESDERRRTKVVACFDASAAMTPIPNARSAW